MIKQKYTYSLVSLVQTLHENVMGGYETISLNQLQDDYETIKRRLDDWENSTYHCHHDSLIKQLCENAILNYEIKQARHERVKPETRTEDTIEYCTGYVDRDW